jgi:hypothetical protein
MRELSFHLGGEVLPEVGIRCSKTGGQPSLRGGSESGPLPSELSALEEQFGGVRSDGAYRVAELGVVSRSHDVRAHPVPGARVDLDHLDLADAATAGSGERVVEDDGLRREP